MLLPYHQTGRVEAGCDEAGRGCLAGPVVAAAVVLPADFYHPLLNDSKQLTEKQRLLLRGIIEQEAVSWAVARVESEEIDQINILNASFAAMHRSLDQFDQVPDFILIDGNRFKRYRQVEHLCVVKGDGKYASIAAASVLAKTHRDEIMEALHLEYPQYNWSSNKGYPTTAHRDAIAEFGVTPWHRKSFRLLPEGRQLELFDITVE
jgi:ribonuclease HII